LNVCRSGSAIHAESGERVAQRLVEEDIIIGILGGGALYADLLVENEICVVNSHSLSSSCDRAVLAESPWHSGNLALGRARFTLIAGAVTISW
jgi:predicted alternative tryptophan synthase beta-subunit